MKFKKYFKIKRRGPQSIKFSKIYYGQYGLKAVESGILTPEIVNTAIKILKRIIKKKNFLISYVNPNTGITRKPRDVRMGRGKGTFAYNVTHVKAGKILFEIKNISEKLSLKALTISSLRLPIKTIIVKQYDNSTNSIKNHW